MGRCTALLLASLFISLGGCSSPGPRTINLMPAPAVFSGGVIDPFPDRAPLTHSDFGLLYATDREPSENLHERPFYLNEAGFIVRMGAATGLSLMTRCWCPPSSGIFWVTAARL